MLHRHGVLGDTHQQQTETPAETPVGTSSHGSTEQHRQEATEQHQQQQDKDKDKDKDKEEQAEERDLPAWLPVHTTSSRERLQQRQGEAVLLQREIEAMEHDIQQQCAQLKALGVQCVPAPAEAS